MQTKVNQKANLPSLDVSLFESLESRRLMAVSAKLEGSLLRVSGTAERDAIYVSTNGNQISVSAGPVGGERNFSKTFDRSQVESLFVASGNGADVIDVRNLGFGSQLNGGIGNDRITGSEFDDNIVADNGNDRIYSLGGDDRISAGLGNDYVEAGNGKDRVHGENGRDTINAQSGVDRIWGEGGADELFGGNGSDYLYGEGEDDILQGQAGNDLMFGGEGRDNLSGGDGSDILNAVGEGIDSVSGGGGRDVATVDSSDTRSVEIASPGPALRSVFLADSFTGREVDSENWHNPDFYSGGTFLGRTQLRVDGQEVPQVKSGSARLKLSSNNPTAIVAGDSFYGSEMIHDRLLSPDSRVVVEATLRLDPNSPPGIVGALFLYKVNGAVRDEIDFELLTNESTGGTHRIFTNTFAAEGFSSAGGVQSHSLPNFSLYDAHTYRIEWDRTAIEWYVDGQMIRRETDRVPQGEMQLRFNTWVPSSTFAQAYSGSFQPAADEDDNVDYLFSVDNVIVGTKG